MNKEEALSEFLRGLRIALNTTFAYSKDHPFFVKSAQNFKDKIDALFNFFDSLKINVAPNSLFIDGKHWGKDIIYTELAQTFHFRKIKSIEFTKGLGLDELVEFLGAISLSIRDIIKQGGLRRVVAGDKMPHILVEELDYSGFLGEEGEDSKDVWIELFNQAVDQQDARKINDFADHFDVLTRKLKTKDLLENEGLRNNISKFFAHLLAKDKERFGACAKELLVAVMEDKGASQIKELDKIKSLFSGLDKDTVAMALWEEISGNNNFNDLSFGVFSHLIGEDMHKDVATGLGEKIKSSEAVRNNPKFRKKLRELFSVEDASEISAVYRHILYSFFTDELAKRSFEFDRESLHKNYHYILLNLLQEEHDEEKLSLIASCFLKESGGLIQEKDAQYLKSLLLTLERKIKEGVPQMSALATLYQQLCQAIESAFFGGDALFYAQHFGGLIRKSYLGADYYSDKIFREGLVNQGILRLFFQFFPEAADLFYDNLQKKKTDMEFVTTVVRSLSSVESSSALGILKKIFFSSNNFIKIEVLKTMQNLFGYDAQFLYMVLDKEDMPLRREALLILIKSERERITALDKVLSIASPWGSKNKILMENIALAEELQLKDIRYHLTQLSKRGFFWNSALRRRAAKALDKIND